MIVVQELTGISPLGKQVCLKTRMGNASLLGTMQSAATTLQQQSVDTALMLTMSEESLPDQDPCQECGQTLVLEVVMMVLSTILTVHQVSFPWVLSSAATMVLIQTRSQTSDASIRTSLLVLLLPTSSGRMLAVVPIKTPGSMLFRTLNTSGLPAMDPSTDSRPCHSVVHSDEAR